MVSVAQPPSPAQCLDMLERAYPQKVNILQAAFESARDVNNFQQGRRLLDMLHRLVSEYLPGYLESGDATARNVFTNNEFAARESDTVTKNKDYMKYRHFDYNGEELEMSKHLKVGVADDATQTIRVHFEVVQEEGKIVIGHCGRHLPLPGRL